MTRFGKFCEDAQLPYGNALPNRRVVLGNVCYDIWGVFKNLEEHFESFHLPPLTYDMYTELSNSFHEYNETAQEPVTPLIRFLMRQLRNKDAELKKIITTATDEDKLRFMVTYLSQKGQLVFVITDASISEELFDFKGYWEYDTMLTENVTIKWHGNEQVATERFLKALGPTFRRQLQSTIDGTTKIKDLFEKQVKREEYTTLLERMEKGDVLAIQRSFNDRVKDYVLSEEERQRLNYLLKKLPSTISVKPGKYLNFQAHIESENGRQFKHSRNERPPGPAEQGKNHPKFDWTKKKRRIDEEGKRGDNLVVHRTPPTSPPPRKNDDSVKVLVKEMERLNDEIKLLEEKKKLFERDEAQFMEGKQNRFQQILKTFVDESERLNEEINELNEQLKRTKQRIEREEAELMEGKKTRFQKVEKQLMSEMMQRVQKEEDEYRRQWKKKYGPEMDDREHSELKKLFADDQWVKYAYENRNKPWFKFLKFMKKDWNSILAWNTEPFDKFWEREISELKALFGGDQQGLEYAYTIDERTLLDFYKETRRIWNMTPTNELAFITHWNVQFRKWKQKEETKQQQRQQQRQQPQGHHDSELNQLFRDSQFWLNFAYKNRGQPWFNFFKQTRKIWNAGPKIVSFEMFWEAQFDRYKEDVKPTQSENPFNFYQQDHYDVPPKRSQNPFNFYQKYPYNVPPKQSKTPFNSRQRYQYNVPPKPSRNPFTSRQQHHYNVPPDQKHEAQSASGEEWRRPQWTGESRMDKFKVIEKIAQPKYNLDDCEVKFPSLTNYKNSETINKLHVILFVLKSLKDSPNRNVQIPKHFTGDDLRIEKGIEIGFHSDKRNSYGSNDPNFECKHRMLWELYTILKDANHFGKIRAPGLKKERIHGTAGSF